MKSVAIVAFTLLLAASALVLWAALNNDPFGGEPVAIVKIDQRLPEGGARAASAEAATSGEDARARVGAIRAARQLPPSMSSGIIGGVIPPFPRSDNDG